MTECILDALQTKHPVSDGQLLGHEPLVGEQDDAIAVVYEVGGRIMAAVIHVPTNSANVVAEFPGRQSMGTAHIRLTLALVAELTA